MPAKPHATPPPGLSPSGVWWIWSPPATARSLGGDAARAAVPLLFPEPSAQQDARAPVLTCLVPRAQPLSESMAGALRRALLLDTCIFSSSRHLLPGYARWASYHPLDDHAVPWLVPWAGRFNLCAPWSPDDRTASRCLFRARGAVNSARPTRFALVLPLAAGARAARVGALCLCRRLPGCHDSSLFLLQNAPADGLYPIDWTALREAGCLDDNFSPPASPSYVPTSCAPRLRWGLGIPAFADSMFLPFLNSSVPFKPPGLPPVVGDAFGYLVSHDRYAGLVGLLPACFASLMEWVFRESGCCVKEAVALANCRADSVRLQLFLHAQRTLRAARRAGPAGRTC